VKLATFLRRYRWSILILLLALAAWWPAFNYLVDFRRPDVPFVVTPNDVLPAMLDLAAVGESDTVYDLGSGDGRVLLAAAARGAKAVGIEINPTLVDRSRQAIRTAGMTERVSVRRGDIFKQDLTPATVITMYLMPDVNAQLRPQLERLRPGTRIVSHMFSMPGATPVRKVVVKSAETGLDHPLYLWVAPIDWE
jgi:SAM-dependent methyltransferase